VSVPLLPVFLDLRGRRVLLVGGGAVAAGKLGALLDAGAEVTVVAPEVRAEIAAAGVRVERRAFALSDLEDVWLVVAAAPPEVNREVAAAAAPLRLFVNAVDDPRHATCYTGGVFRRGGVTVALSTAGEAPALAGLLREGLETLVPDDVSRWRRAARLLKRLQRRGGVPMAERRPQLLRALNRLYERRGAGRAGSGPAPKPDQTTLLPDLVQVPSAAQVPGAVQAGSLPDVGAGPAPARLGPTPATQRDGGDA